MRPVKNFCLLTITSILLASCAASYEAQYARVSLPPDEKAYLDEQHQQSMFFALDKSLDSNCKPEQLVSGLQSGFQTVFDLQGYKDSLTPIQHIIVANSQNSNGEAEGRRRQIGRLQEEIDQRRLAFENRPDERSVARIKYLEYQISLLRQLIDLDSVSPEPFAQHDALQLEWAQTVAANIAALPANATTFQQLASFEDSNASFESDCASYRPSRINQAVVLPPRTKNFEPLYQAIMAKQREYFDSSGFHLASLVRSSSVEEIQTQLMAMNYSEYTARAFEESNIGKQILERREVLLRTEALEEQYRQETKKLAALNARRILLEGTSDWSAIENFNENRPSILQNQEYPSYTVQTIIGCVPQNGYPNIALSVGVYGKDGTDASWTRTGETGSGVPLAVTTDGNRSVLYGVLPREGNEQYINKFAAYISTEEERNAVDAPENAGTDTLEGALTTLFGPLTRIMNRAEAATGIGLLQKGLFAGANNIQLSGRIDLGGKQENWTSPNLVSGYKLIDALCPVDW